MSGLYINYNVYLLIMFDLCHNNRQIPSLPLSVNNIIHLIEFVFLLKFVHIRSVSSLDKCNFIYSGIIAWHDIRSLPNRLFLHECNHFFRDITIIIVISYKAKALIIN